MTEHTIELLPPSQPSASRDTLAHPAAAPSAGATTAHSRSFWSTGSLLALAGASLYASVQHDYLFFKELIAANLIIGMALLLKSASTRIA